MSTTRAATEGRQTQGINERVAYAITTTPVGASPTSPACFLYDISNPDTWVDVSASKLSGSASAAGDVITSPLVIDLVNGAQYRLIWRWTSSGQRFERYVDILAER